MKDIQTYLILLIPLTLGYFIGALSMWDLVKRYKKAQGYNPDPFDGNDPTRLEKFVLDR